MENDFKKFLRLFLEKLIIQTARVIVDEWVKETEISENDKMQVIEEIKTKTSEIVGKIIEELENKGIRQVDDLEKREPLLRTIIVNTVRESLSKPYFEMNKEENV